jgi:hypothetical protein
MGPLAIDRRAALGAAAVFAAGTGSVAQAAAAPVAEGVVWCTEHGFDPAERAVVERWFARCLAVAPEEGRLIGAFVSMRPDEGVAMALLQFASFAAFEAYRRRHEAAWAVLASVGTQRSMFLVPVEG